MASIQSHLSRFVLTIALVFPIISTVSAQDDVPLTKISSSAYAEHAVIARAFNQNGLVTGTTPQMTASGTTSATASSAPVGLRAGAAVSDPDANSDGYGINTALAGAGNSRTTMASCYRLLGISADPYPSGADIEMQHAAEGEARFKIPSSVTGDTWIQAEIELLGTGTLNPPDGDIIVEVAAWGLVQVS